jgi:hypothetical protein
VITGNTIILSPIEMYRSCNRDKSLFALKHSFKMALSYRYRGQHLPNSVASAMSAIASTIGGVGERRSKSSRIFE